MVRSPPYSSADIADIFSTVLDREVILQQVLPQDWQSTLEQAGFSNDAARNLGPMIAAVMEAKTEAETSEPIRLSADFRTYLEGIVNK